VREVVRGGPAARAGLRSGDVIVSVGGSEVRNADDVADVIADRRPGERVTVEFRREGATRSVEVTLRSRPAP
jgi:S1-C subfamily serine protease